jgi:hypothetical protein
VHEIRLPPHGVLTLRRCRGLRVAVRTGRLRFVGTGHERGFVAPGKSSVIPSDAVIECHGRAPAPMQVDGPRRRWPSSWRSVLHGGLRFAAPWLLQLLVARVWR